MLISFTFRPGTKGSRRQNGNYEESPFTKCSLHRVSYEDGGHSDTGTTSDSNHGARYHRYPRKVNRCTGLTAWSVRSSHY